MSKDDPIIKELEVLFKDKQEAYGFIVLYSRYIEMIDDIVDEPKDIDLVQKMTSLGCDLFNHSYWQKHWQFLYLVEKLINIQYFDAVRWENAQEEWKRRDARVLNHCGYNIMFAIIYIEFGEEVLKTFSLRFRERVHNYHLDEDNGKIYELNKSA